MSIQLSQEQFSELIESVSRAGKKKGKSIIKDFTNSPNLIDWINNDFEFLPVSKLISCDLPDFYVNNIIHNLENCDQKAIPIICSDSNKRQFFYKENGAWINNKKFIEVLKYRIFQNALSQVKEKYINPIVDNKNYNYDCDEQTFEQSKTYDKMVILAKLCDIDKYPTTKLHDKILIKLAKKIKEEIIDSD